MKNMGLKKDILITDYIKSGIKKMVKILKIIAYAFLVISFFIMMWNKYGY
jgi:hypothetical protein